MANVPTQTELLNALQQSAAVIKRQEKALAAYREPIAIIGMACVYPGGADSPERFWRNLLAGVDAITELPASRAGDIRRNGGQRDTTPSQGGFLEQVDGFDAFFFGLSPREVEMMDPAHRLLLETTWQALEDANLIPGELFNQEIGVFVGGGVSGYLQPDGGAGHDLYTVTGNTPSTAAGRVSYLLGLTGPCMAVDTACSASLTAIHLACQSLRNGECSAAIAGGVSLMLDEAATAIFASSQMLAADARCKTFDDNANGYVRGEGCGLLVLKPLSAAQTDGDRILAVIRGTAINQDGPSGGLTVPNGPSQERVICRALKDARLKPEQISYIEAHGTGTPLGDPIEIGALGAIFQGRSTPLYVGSVKTNVGHLEFAAGVAGVMKVVLALQHQTIPPHLHLKTPNQRIDWASFPVRIPTAATPWLPSDPTAERIAGISSFGFSGTNAHAVVGEAPRGEEEWGKREEGEKGSEGELFVLSAKSEVALREYATRYVGFLAAHPKVNLADLCYTAQSGRSHFPHRLGVAAASMEQLQEALRAFAQGQPQTAVSQAIAPVTGKAGKIAFLFTGQGAQYVGMGRDLYESEPIFRDVLDRCDAAFREATGRSLIELIYPAAPPNHNDLMESHPCGQAANFALECALADLWRAWGVRPDFVLGHSLGDFAAAYTAGVIDLEDGLRLVIERGRLMEAALGAMLSVLGSEAEVLPHIADLPDVTIGVINGPRSVVLSGSHAAVALASERLQVAGFKTRKLDIPVAAHSPMLDPVLDAFAAAVGRVHLSAPTLPVVSSMTGKRVSSELTDPAYWRRHLRQTVRFADGIETLATEGCQLFVEIGPKSTLLGLVGQTLDTMTGWQGDKGTDPSPATLLPPHLVTPSSALLPSLRQGQPDRQQMLASLGELYVRGIKIDWTVLHRDAPRRKISLPTYPFQRQRYWINPHRSPAPTRGKEQGEGLRPLIRRMTRLPLHRETLFESDISPEQLPFLADHRVFARMVSPGACQVALALSAAELLYGQPAVQVEDLILPQPLLVAEPGEADGRAVQAIFADSTPAAAGAGTRAARHTFQVISFTNDDGQPQTHVTGYAAPLAGPPAAVDLADLRERCAQPVDVDEFYAGMEKAHIGLGPAFRWLAEAWQNEEISADPPNPRSILARLRLPEAIAGTSGYLIHPGLLDACFQTVGIAGMTDGETRLPFAAQSMRLYAPVTGEAWWCHARQGRDGKGAIELLDDEGHLLLAVEGFEIRPVRTDAIQGAHLHADWLYTLSWETVPVEASDPAFSPAGWLLLGDDGALTAGLAQHLSAQGGVVTVLAGECYSFLVNGAGGGTATVDPTQPGHFRQLLADAAERYLSLGVVYLWGAQSGAESDDIPALTLRQSSGLLHLAQALADAPLLLSPQGDGPGARALSLWLVTQNSQVVSGNEHPPQPGVQAAAGALWGLGRTLAQEMPGVGWSAIDLDGDDPAAQADLLLAELTRTAAPAAPLAGQIAWRDGVRYAARLRRWSLPTQGQAMALHRDRSYLVTGGLGGLGLETAQQLIDDGARHLVLSGRSGAKSEAAQTALSRWREAGVSVQVVQADIAHWEDAERLLAACDALAPLAGIVHAAGVLDDGALGQQSAERFQRVMQPKVAGTWHLHRLTEQRALDFFVCFSSIASLLGSAGQSNYAAANAFVDGLMAQRRAAGLPGCAIQWGPWAEVGLAAHLSGRMAAQGMGMIAPAQGRAILQRLLIDGPALVGVIPARLSPLGEIAAQADSLKPPTTQNGTPRLGEALRAASPAEQAALLETYLRREIAQVLRLPAGLQIDPEDQFFQMGFDSLMAVELKNRIQNALGAPLRATLIFDHPTLAGLVEHLMRDNRRNGTESALPPLVKVEGDQPLPLSFAQQRLWFNQTSNRTNSYNIIAPFRLEGKLDATALERGLTILQERHEVLRTTFPTVDGEAIQVIGGADPVRVLLREMPGLSAEEEAIVCEQIIQQEVTHLYNLAEGPLCRVVLVRFGEERHLLLFSFNHILIDAASLSQILQELGILYAGYLRGERVNLPALAYRYADYAHWQRRTMTPEIVAQRVQHWVERLDRPTPLFELHSNYPRPAKESFRGAAFPFQIGPDQTQRLQSLQKETGATLFSALLAAWTGLLHRYGTQDELVVGSPFYNRPHEDLTGVAGHWGSMLLLPLEFTPEMTFGELVRQVNQRRQEAVANDAPIDQLVPVLPPTRKRNNLPHQLFFSFLPGREARGLKLADVKATSLEKSSVTMRPDMALTAWEEPSPAGLRVQGSWEYKMELFDGEYVGRMIEDFYIFLDRVLTEPTCPIQRVALPHWEQWAAQLETV